MLIKDGEDEFDDQYDDVEIEPDDDDVDQDEVLSDEVSIL
jgi:hypothetical protein